MTHKADSDLFHVSCAIKLFEYSDSSVFQFTVPTQVLRTGLDVTVAFHMVLSVGLNINDLPQTCRLFALLGRGNFPLYSEFSWLINKEVDTRQMNRRKI